MENHPSFTELFGQKLVMSSLEVLLNRLKDAISQIAKNKVL